LGDESPLKTIKSKETQLLFSKNIENDTISPSATDANNSAASPNAKMSLAKPKIIHVSMLLKNNHERQVSQGFVAKKPKSRKHSPEQTKLVEH
jgi:hypothetical protein